VAGWLATIVTYTDAPMGDTFRAVIQLLGIRGSTADESVLRVSMKVSESE